MISIAMSVTIDKKDNLWRTARYVRSVKTAESRNVLTKSESNQDRRSRLQNVELRFRHSPVSFFSGDQPPADGMKMRFLQGLRPLDIFAAGCRCRVTNRTGRS
jgi:hypothetical protein